VRLVIRPAAREDILRQYRYFTGGGVWKASRGGKLAVMQEEGRGRTGRGWL